MVGQVEFLEVGFQQGVGALVGGGGGEHIPAQGIQIEPGDAGQALSDAVILGRSGGGFEHHRVAHDSGGHEARQLFARHQAVLLEHGGHDGGGGAHGLVAHEHGVARLHVGQAVMVDDAHQLGLVQALHGLAHLVVVHQHDALAPGPHQVIPAQGADDLIVRVQHGIGAVAGLQHSVLHIVQEIVQVEADQLVRLGDTAHGRGLVQHPGGAPGVVGRGDHAGRRT